MWESAGALTGEGMSVGKSHGPWEGYDRGRETLGTAMTTAGCGNPKRRRYQEKSPQKTPNKRGAAGHCLGNPGRNAHYPVKINKLRPLDKT